MSDNTTIEKKPLRRTRRSLAGKTTLVLILFSLVISIAAISFGYYLYYSSVVRDYRNRAWQMSRTANQFMDKDEALDEAAQVIYYYYTMPEEERDQLHDKSSPLLSAFDGVRGESFDALRATLRSIQENNGGMAAFTAFIDSDTNRRVFVADSDPGETFCPPGSWDEYSEENIRDLTEGRSYFLDEYFGLDRITATIMNMEPYGYRCMAATVIGVVDGHPVYVIFDTDMNAALKAVWKFLWIYLALLAVITAAALIAVIRHINKNTVRPVNQLAEAAMAYTRDRSDEHRDTQHFAKLDIRTGDEIERLSDTMKSMEADLGSYMRNLTRVTAERERISTELSLATRIQANMLPSIFPAFPERKEFDIYAIMDPAKEVGGDFYDFFLVDDDHLGIVMADVSGKGVPAALFMMISKTLVNNAAMLGLSPAKVLENVNSRICANNREQMFVTVWLGILELSTGRLVAANAGHERPAVKMPGGSFELFKDPHGLVVGCMDGMRYTDYELVLEPGAKLFIYTDGVAEATDPSLDQFGMERMIEALNACGESSPRELIDGVRSAVDSFAGGAEQFDDITMLCIEYFGRKQ